MILEKKNNEQECFQSGVSSGPSDSAASMVFSRERRSAAVQSTRTHSDCDSRTFEVDDLCPTSKAAVPVVPIVLIIGFNKIYYSENLNSILKKNNSLTNVLQ